MPDGAADIGVQFSEAVEYFRRALAIGTDEWLQILAEEGQVSAAIADDLVRSVTGDLVAAIGELVETGGTIDDFRARYQEIVRARGWSYNGSAGWHSQLVYRLWTGNAYAAGRWEQAVRLEVARPGTMYGRLVTVGDHRVRHTHAQMHGIILPITHKYWDTHWPPNGFNCRCHVQIVSAREIARYGWTVTSSRDPRLKIPPDQGWATNPGKAGARLKQLQRAREGV